MTAHTTPRWIRATTWAFVLVPCALLMLAVQAGPPPASTGRADAPQVREGYVEVQWRQTQPGITEGVVVNRTGYPLPNFQLRLARWKPVLSDGFYAGREPAPVSAHFGESSSYANDFGTTILLTDTRCFFVSESLTFLPVRDLVATYGSSNNPLPVVQGRYTY